MRDGVVARRLTTLLGPTSGWARVLGIDVAREPRRVRPLINMVSGGESSGYGLLTVRENLWMFAQFYGVPSKEAYRRIDTMLAAVGAKFNPGSKLVVSGHMLLTMSDAGLTSHPTPVLSVDYSF